MEKKARAALVPEKGKLKHAGSQQLYKDRTM